MVVVCAEVKFSVTFISEEKHQKAIIQAAGSKFL